MHGNRIKPGAPYRERGRLSIVSTKWVRDRKYVVIPAGKPEWRAAFLHAIALGVIPIDYSAVVRKVMFAE